MFFEQGAILLYHKIKRVRAPFINLLVALKQFHRVLLQ